MAINGIYSYGMGSGYYSYQAAVNNARLVQALSRNPQIQSAADSIPAVSSTSSLKDSLDFVKSYNSSMSSLMQAAMDLKSTNSSGVMQNYNVTSSDSAVAEASKNLPIRTAGDITLAVVQTAQAQTNVSASVNASQAATEAIDFTISGIGGSARIQVDASYESGAAKTNAQMLREAAQQINDQDVGVRATVVEENGEASLLLESARTGQFYGFQTSGQMGAAAGADQVQTAGTDAQYSVTENGVTRDYSSSRNDITLNGGRISVSLKGTGETTIRSDVDPDNVASALQNLTDKYNNALKVLNDNYGRGTGVDRQLRNLVRGLGAEESLEMLGITVNKDATLNFDAEVLAENMEKNPSLIKDLISGTGGIADTAFNKAVGGMNMNSSSLINEDISNLQYENMYNNPFQFLGMYSRGNSYLQNNFYAVGLMMNYLV